MKHPLTDSQDCILFSIIEIPRTNPPTLGYKVERINRKLVIENISWKGRRKREHERGEYAVSSRTKRKTLVPGGLEDTGMGN